MSNLGCIEFKLSGFHSQERLSSVHAGCPNLIKFHVSKMSCEVVNYFFAMCVFGEKCGL